MYDIKTEPNICNSQTNFETILDSSPAILCVHRLYRYRFYFMTFHNIDDITSLYTIYH